MRKLKSDQMRIRRLNLLLTYRCNSHCRHCCYFCGLDGKGLMTAAQVSKYLRALEEHPLESVWIYGGEPFLYPRVLTEVVKIARRHNIPEIGVLTNGYWARRKKTAQKRLEILREAGVTSLTVSTDGFHAEGITPEMAYTAGHMALDAGIEQVDFSITFLPPRGSSNRYNDLSEDIWERLERTNGIPLREKTVTMIGRAAEGLLEHCQLKKLRRKNVCRPPDYIGGSWRNPQGLEIDPYGWIMVCPGMSLGRIGERSLADILQRYKKDGGPLWQSLWERGPHGLLDMAVQKGYQPLSGYVDYCHLCYHVRKFLQPHFQISFSPQNCYQEPVETGRRMQ